MIWRMSAIVALLSALFVACGNGELTTGGEKATPIVTEEALAADDEAVSGIFARALRYLEANCLKGQGGVACNRRVEDLEAICVVAQAGGGEYVQWGGVFEDKKLTISGHLAPFCDRLEIILAEPVFTARPHLIELAQDIEDSMGY